MIRSSVAGCALLWVVIVAGCGGGGREAPPIAAVTGTVTNAGKPVSAGVVSFVSAEGFGVSAPLSSDGTYTLESEYGRGIPLGEYSVLVAPPPPEGIDPNDPAALPPQREYPEIPEKVRNPSTSGLKATVTEGPNQIDFDLSK